MFRLDLIIAAAICLAAILLLAWVAMRLVAALERMTAALDAASGARTDPATTLTTARHPELGDAGDIPGWVEREARTLTDARDLFPAREEPEPEDRWWNRGHFYL